VAYFLAVAQADLSSTLVLGAFVPLSLGVEWYLQGRHSFCATLGFTGRYALGWERGAVTDEDARAADRRLAFRLALLGLFGGGVLAAAGYSILSAL
jgi:hypothetical protein